MTFDIADIIAGELKVSRATAYDLMREALKEAASMQEPVLWMDSGDDIFYTEEDAYKVGFQPIRPLYTSPPNVATPLDDTPHLAAQRPVPQERKWVGLSDLDTQ